MRVKGARDTYNSDGGFLCDSLGDGGCASSG
jgi:hypothetical protein